ncbi:UNVERIFIED_ORG: hypothetical protein J2W19_004664 [Shinella zoogloeoides]|nr:hypothetical protein [Shinella zoogloeoides]
MDSNIARALKMIDELRSLVRELEGFKGKDSARDKAIDKLVALKTAELDLQEKIVEFYRNRASSK